MRQDKVLKILVTMLTGLLVLAITYKPTKTIEKEQAEIVQIDIIDSRSSEVEELAKANGFKASKRIIDAILIASETYSLDHLEMTAIAIVETGLGSNTKTRKNSNGTYDKGLFQINTVNYPKCVEYNLDSFEGSALCAAKLLSSIKSKRADYIGVYHSKTCRKDFCPKKTYMQKVTQVLAQTSDN